MGYGIPNFEEAFGALQILGQQEQLLRKSAIYPNPVSDILNINFPAATTKGYLEIYSVLENGLCQGDS